MEGPLHGRGKGGGGGGGEGGGEGGLIFVRGCGNVQTGCRNRVGFYPRGLYPRNQLPDYSITAYQHGVCLI